MASSQKTIDYLTDQIHSTGVIRSKKMFGEYAIYCDEKVVALVCDDILYVKMTDVSLQFLNASHISPPYPGAKNYLKVPEEKWDETDWLTDLISHTAASLPLPKVKKRKSKKMP